jgi:hypothetical protein
MELVNRLRDESPCHDLLALAVFNPNSEYMRSQVM